MEQLFWTMVWKLPAENGRATEKEELGCPDTVEPLSPALVHLPSFYMRGEQNSTLVKPLSL